MGDQLNQNQIDDLLKRLTHGEPVEDPDQQKHDGKLVKDYDFKSPKKLTKEQLKALEDLHESFSRVLSTYFSGAMRQFCEVTVLQIEEQLYYDFSSAIPDNAYVGMYDLRPKNKHYEELSLIMNLSPSIGYYMIDRMLGGNGDAEPLERAFTELETEILRNCLEKVAHNMQTSWDSYIETDITFAGIETNSRMMQQTLAPKDIVVLVMLELKVNGAYVGNIDLCIPATGLGELINHFNNKYQKSSRRELPDAGEVKQKLFDNIVVSDVEVKVVLGELILDVQDVLNLQVNDIIPLNKSIDSDAIVYVDNELWFEGRLGEVRKKKAVKLSNIIVQDENIEKRGFYGDR